MLLWLSMAGWYQTGNKLRVPGNVTLLHLPPYSPGLNPVENVWAYRRRNKIENMFGRLKDWRHIHIRYDRCVHTFMPAIRFAAVVIAWL